MKTSQFLPSKSSVFRIGQLAIRIALPLFGFNSEAAKNTEGFAPIFPPQNWQECFDFQPHHSKSRLSEGELRTIESCRKLFSENIQDYCKYSGVEAFRLTQAKTVKALEDGDFERIEPWAKGLYPHEWILKHILPDARATWTDTQRMYRNYPPSLFRQLLNPPSATDRTTAIAQLKNYLMEDTNTEGDNVSWAESKLSAFEAARGYERLCAPFKLSNTENSICQDSIAFLLRSTFEKNKDLLATQGVPVIKPYFYNQLFIEVLSDLSMSEPLTAVALTLLDQFNAQVASEIPLPTLLSRAVGPEKMMKIFGLISTLGGNLGGYLSLTQFNPKSMSENEYLKSARLRFSLILIAQLIPYFDFKTSQTNSGSTFSLPPEIKTTCAVRKTYHFWSAAYNAWYIHKNLPTRAGTSEGALRSGASAAAFGGSIAYQTLPVSQTGRSPKYFYQNKPFGGWSNTARFDLTLSAAGALFGANWDEKNPDQQTFKSQSVINDLKTAKSTPILIDSVLKEVILNSNAGEVSELSGWYGEIQLVNRAFDLSRNSDWARLIQPFLMYDIFKGLVF